MKKIFILLIFILFIYGCVNTRSTQSISSPLKKIGDDFAWYVFDDDGEYIIN